MTAVGPHEDRIRRALGVLTYLGGAALSLLALLLVRGPVTWALYLALTGAVFVGMVVLTYRRRPRLRPVAFALGWFCAPLVVGIAFFWWMGDLGDYVLARKFDAHVWQAKSNAAFDDRTRLRMVKDLRSSGLLDGITREEAVRLLGEPLEGPSHANELVWRVGPGSMIDLRLLRLRFGPDDRVVEHQLFDG